MSDEWEDLGFEREKGYEFWCVGDDCPYRGSVTYVSAAYGAPVAVHLSSGRVLNWANIVSYKAVAP